MEPKGDLVTEVMLAGMLWTKRWRAGATRCGSRPGYSVAVTFEFRPSHISSAV